MTSASGLPAQAASVPDVSGTPEGQQLPVTVSMAQQLQAAQAQIASQQLQLQAQREQLHEAQVGHISLAAYAVYPCAVMCI
jgi:hypothetical protein